MPDPSTHASWIISAATAALGWLSMIIAFMFDVPAPVIFAAFVGSCFGVAFSDAVTYQKAVLTLAAGTLGAGMLVSFVAFILSLSMHSTASYPLRGVATILAFVLVKFWPELMQIIRYQLGKFAGKAGGDDAAAS